MNNFSILSRRTKIIFAILIVLLLIGAAFSLFTPGRAEVGERGPDQRPSEWDWQRRTFPYGKADDDAHLVAVRQAQQMRLDQRFKNDGILSAAQWELMGPTNIGGRITDIEFNPKNPAIVYAAAASGGVFKSRDTGNSWQPVFDEQSAFSMGDIAVDPQNPETVYVGTGEANAQHNAFPGGGVFKTTNGGKSWQNVGLVGTVAIGRVVVDPQDPQRVFVAALGSGFAYNSNRGLFRSDDGGKTWAKKLYINDSTGVIDVVVNPDEPNIVYAAAWERNRRMDYRRQFGMASGIFKSEDGGETWAKLDEANGLPDADNVPIGRIGLAMCAGAPDILYASIANGNEYIGIFKTENDGKNWTKIEAVPTTHGFSWYFGQVRVRPDDPDNLFMLDTEFMHSSDGGSSWDFILDYSMMHMIHVDHHALAFHPQNSNYLISGNDGGMHISKDGGFSWRKVENLPITQFYEISLDVQNPHKIYGGTQDNNTIRTQTGSRDDWEAILGGDGFYSIVDPTDTNIIYAEYQNGMLFKSMDGGIFFFDALMGIDTLEARNWSTPVVMDPQDSRTLYYGAEHIYRTTNGADSWEAISPKLSPVESYLYGTVSTIAIAPSNRNYIYTGTDDGYLWVSKDGGNNWNEITNGTPERWVTRIAVDPNDPEVAYATYSGLKWRDDVPHVFKTTNAGESWQNISANLPQAPVNAFAIDPFKTNILYLGSDVGAFVSFNGGASWSVLGEGMPVTSVYDMKIHPKEHFLVAGTHGRSAYKIRLDNLTSIEDEKSFKKALKFACSPNPFKNETWISGQLPRAGKVRLKIFDSQGREIRTFPAENLDAGEFSRMWDAKDGSGKHVAPGAYMAQMLYYYNGTLYAETQNVLKIK